MKKIKSLSLIILLLAISVSFTSCFQVIEDILIHANGSGDYGLTVNMSESRSNIVTVMKAGKVNGKPIPSEAAIKKEFNDMLSLLKKQPGISAVNGSLDEQNYIAKVHLHFAQVNNLNNVLTAINGKYKLKLAIPSTYDYDVAHKTFTRKYLYSNAIKNAYNDLGKGKSGFNGATYTSIYHFDEDVLKMSNGSAKISSNKKAVMQKDLITDLVMGKKTFTNSINLK